jgi:hypothetical protein
LLSEPVVGEEGNGFNILGGAWCGTNTLNDVAVLESFVSILDITWWVPSSGNRYFTEK